MRAVLTWHSIDPSGSPISVDDGSFADQVRFLASGRVRVVPLETIAALPGDDDAVALTFDDGFRNFAERAWPRLRDAGLPVTVFVVSQHAGGDNRWGGADDPGIPTLPLLGWDELGRLAAEGLSLGSHSRTHRPLPSLSPQELADELAGSRAEIEARTGRRPATFAYPFGDVDAPSAAAAAREYAVSVTTEMRALAPGDRPETLPRLDAYYYRRPGSLDGFGTPAFRRRLATITFRRRVRRALFAALGRGSRPAAKGPGTAPPGRYTP